MPQTEKKVHVTLGKEIFGKEYEGKRAVIVRALYGLKSAGASWMVFDPLRYDIEWISFGEESHPMRHVEKKLISTFLLMQIMRGIELHGDLIQVSLSS